ncbi:oxygen-independent coproporphyrinogen III oxidase [Cellvibrio sp. pealriver]|uniref:oxygen-independent coproporphyrinogen III oxidase n=1 Tax=Cellvibrio sp. pealriver TaxID=1622269 RepID=UPI00066FB84A|nr:oxygen-independent coproporphyrinogen III oxidase [Cellvibrio sp. pealriver]
MRNFEQPLEWDSLLIHRYDLAGPRYTSYPTAPQFREAFSQSALFRAIVRSNLAHRPLSLYFHIPFCESLCYYCGCNKVVTHNKSRALPYIQRMIQELSLYADLFEPGKQVQQVHWGGGTPTFISDDEMSLLMNASRRLFSFADDESAEFSIEIHPGQIAPDRLRHLRKLGFNRISMGVQDFDPHVQRAVNRFNTYEQVADLTRATREHQYQSISMDLIYGLPLQNQQSLHNTLQKVIDLEPDRLSLFNYAHMPHLFKSQKMISESELPSPAEKLDMLQHAIETLQVAGYVYIGMDHFAKPSDPLAIAQQQGKLQRNFQGYSTHGNCDLLALGVSSISMIDNVYVQNAKDLTTYQQKMDMGLLPIMKGFSLNQEDILRRFVINQLICHFELAFADVMREFGIDAQAHFQKELIQLQPMREDGLLSINSSGIYVHNKGRLLIRRICMVFDEYLQKQQSTVSPIRYSKII